jgi:hypothetical protein
MEKDKPSQRLTAYQQKLRDPRWQKKRLQVLERDGWACQTCQDTTTTLHVHHMCYSKGKDPWEYPMSALQTLCEECHLYETERRPDHEAHLLTALRWCYYDAEDVLHLALAFGYWENMPEPKAIAKAVLWMMKDPAIMREMVERSRAAYQAYREQEPLGAIDEGK